MNIYTIKVKVSDEICYRDIERLLNKLDADTEVLKVEEESKHPKDMTPKEIDELLERVL